MSKIVSVPGLGNVMSQPLRMISDGINYERKNIKKDDYLNHHNEKLMTVAFNRNDWVNDTTTLNFNCTADRCELKLAMDSYVDLFWMKYLRYGVGVGLYNDGYFHLSFDRASQVWSMKAFRNDDAAASEWKFCSPDSAVGHVLSILEYLGRDTQAEVATANMSGAWQTLAQGNQSEQSPAYATLSSLRQSIESQKATILKSAALYSKEEDCNPKSVVQDDPGAFATPVYDF